MRYIEFLNDRILFTIRFCQKCHIYSEVLETFNSKLPINKRIKMIDCTKFHDFGIVDNPLIIKYLRYFEGNYPTLFFDGEIVKGAESKAELEAWLSARLIDDFIIEETPLVRFEKGSESMLFNDQQNCEWKKGFFGRRKAICR